MMSGPVTLPTRPEWIECPGCSLPVSPERGSWTEHIAWCEEVADYERIEWLLQQPEAFAEYKRSVRSMAHQPGPSQPPKPVGDEIWRPGSIIISDEIPGLTSGRASRWYTVLDVMGDAALCCPMFTFGGRGMRGARSWEVDDFVALTWSWDALQDVVLEPGRREQRQRAPNAWVDEFPKGDLYGRCRYAALRVQEAYKGLTGRSHFRSNSMIGIRQPCWVSRLQSAEAMGRLEFEGYAELRAILDARHPCGDGPAQYSGPLPAPWPRYQYGLSQPQRWN